ncbi:hypothetical protein DY000_02045289 [Brassica cretica]|uniref:Uncharacterized protein n=1 Tax=Brassica cretica TaxID=69181 RepID=A0ABQ7EXU0_BRACR|nr:hypothetical protein DY000_02045289 [Brassica cretica]
MAEQFEDKTGEIPPIPSDPRLDPPPPSPSSNSENTMFMPENSFFDDITMLLFPVYDRRSMQPTRRRLLFVACRRGCLEMGLSGASFFILNSRMDRRPSSNRI